MRKLSQLFVLACSLGCSEGTTYFRLESVDSTPVPVEITEQYCCPIILNGGSTHILDDTQLTRTLDFHSFQRNPAGISNETYYHLSVSGAYTRVDSLLIITYAVGSHMTGPDTAFLHGDQMTIPLRAAAAWSQRLLHYRRAKLPCDPVAGPC